MAQEPDHQGIIDLLKQKGEDVNEGQPEQVAGRWIENGFEHPSDVEEWLSQGVISPEDARARIDDGTPKERHEDQTDAVRDEVRGTTKSRSRPGDPLDQEPQAPGSAP